MEESQSNNQILNSKPNDKTKMKSIGKIKPVGTLHALPSQLNSQKVIDQNEYSSHEHITEPVINCHQQELIVQSLVQQLIGKVQNIVKISERAKIVTVNQTLKVLLDDPNLGFLDSTRPIPQHMKVRLSQDAQPIALRAVDKVTGHLKVNKKKLNKKDSLNSDASNSTKNLISKKSKSVIKYSRSSQFSKKQKQQLRISLLDSNTNCYKRSLQQIAETKDSFIPLSQFKNEDQDKQQRFIKYLRFVKEGDGKNHILQQLDEQTNEMLKSQSEKCANNLRSESLKATMLNERKRASLKNLSNQNLAQIQNAQSIMKLMRKKESLSYKNCVTVAQRRLQHNTYSFDQLESVKRNNIIEIKENLNFLEKIRKKNQLLQLKSGKLQKKYKGKNTNKKQQLKLPSLTLKNSSNQEQFEQQIKRSQLQPSSSIKSACIEYEKQINNMISSLKFPQSIQVRVSNKESTDIKYRSEQIQHKINGFNNKEQDRLRSNVGYRQKC